MAEKTRKAKKTRQKMDGKTTQPLFETPKIKRSKGKSDIHNTKLYGTSGYVRPPKTVQKIELTKFEMIMLWRQGKQPFFTQKLEFGAKRGMKNGWEEANKIRKLLISAGGFRSRDMRIIAIGMSGAFEAYKDEYKVHVTADRKLLRKAIRKALKLRME